MDCDKVLARFAFSIRLTYLMDRLIDREVESMAEWLTSSGDGGCACDAGFHKPRKVLFCVRFVQGQQVTIVRHGYACLRSEDHFSLSQDD